MKKILCTIFLIFFLTTQGYSLTRVEIRNEIRKILNDTPYTNQQQRWSNSLINQRINLAQDDICSKTRCLRNTFTITTTTGVREYDLPDNLLIIERVAYLITGTTDAWKKLEFSTLRTLDGESSEWENQGDGLPTKYCERGKHIVLKPTPSGTHAKTDALYIDGYALGDSLTSDTSVPFNNIKFLYPYHELIIYYVVSLCYLDEGRDATFFQTKYMMGIKQLQDDLVDRPDRTGQGQLRVR